LSRLLLVDGLSLLYRGFFAIRSLTTSSGIPTNGLFGFVRMMDQLRRVCEPTHLMVAFDGGLPPERVALVPTYKAQRDAMPEEMRQQLPLVNEYLSLSAIPFLRLDQCEADDIIATVARARPDDTEVFIATSDKDLFQLVGDGTCIISPSGENQRMTREGVFEKTGVWPEQIVEWLALTGDASDNIPGLKGVGPKTAAKLLSEFGSLESLWNRTAEVQKEKLRNQLIENRGLVERNAQMVRLVDNIEGIPDFAELAVRPPARELLAFFDRVEFHAMARKLREPELF